MCGRFFEESPPDEIAARFEAQLPEQLEFEPRYNIAPNQQVLVVRYDRKQHTRTLDHLRWGLIPHFARDPKIAYKRFNARNDAVETRPMFRTAFAKRRCLIVADGFFEWRARGKERQPYAIARADRQPFGLAGIWENWMDPATGEWIRSCAVITTEANELVAPIHDRMPVIVDQADYGKWLGETPAESSELTALLRPYPAGALVMWPVDRRVNKPDVDDASLLDRVDETPAMKR